MTGRRKVDNLLALALLALLTPGEAMHPYQMATVLRRTGKAEDMDVRTGSLYTVVRNLERHGFIEAAGTQQAGRRPQRTLYTITDQGRDELTDWLRDLVATPAHGYSKFEAALSALGALHPEEATALLAERLRALDEDVAERRSALEAHRREVARLFLVESEYALAMRESEAAWVRALLTELEQGTFETLVGWRGFHEHGEPSSGFTDMLAEEAPTTDP